MNVKHPVLLGFIWLFIGYLGMGWGIQTVANWVTIVFGVYGTYVMCSKFTT